MDHQKQSIGFNNRSPSTPPIFASSGTACILFSFCAGCCRLDQWQIFSGSRYISIYIYTVITPPFKFFRKLVQHATKQKLTLPNSAVAIAHSKNAPKRLANHHSCQPIFQLLPSQIVAKWLNSRQGCCHVAQNSKGHADH